jgi:hypothetical protein
MTLPAGAMIRELHTVVVCEARARSPTSPWEDPGSAQRALLAPAPAGETEAGLASLL